MTTTLIDRVRCAFTTDPFSVTPTWVDISTDVQLYAGISVTRGKGDRYSSVNPGTMNLSLDNPDGRYSPGFAAGVHYPNVVLKKRIQWQQSIDAGANWFTRFDGFVDQWATQWNNETASWADCQVVASDRSKFFATQELPNDIYEATILADGPSDYWPLDDPAGTAHPVNLAGGTELALSVPQSGITFSGTTTFGVYDGIGPDGEKALQCADRWLQPAAGSLIYGQAAGAGILRQDCTCEGWWKADAINLFPPFGYSFTLAAVGDTTFTNLLGIDIDGSSQAEAFSSVNSVSGVGPILGDGDWHHIVGVFTGAAVSPGSITLYVDGVNVGSTAQPLPAVFNGSVLRVAQPVDALLHGCAHVALYQYSLTAGQVLTHYNAGLDGFAGEDSTARAQRIFALAGITPTTVGTAGTRSMAPLAGMGGAKLADLLQQVQDTENGVIAVGPDGTPKIVSRRTFDNPTIAVTLGQDQYDSSLRHITDDQKLLNDFTATGSTGNAQRVTNPALAYLGTIDDSKTLYTDNDDEVLAYAQRRIVDGVPAPRFDTVNVDVLTQLQETGGPALCLAIWAADLGQALQLQGLPSGAPATIMTQQIQGYVETRTHDSYGVNYNTTPAFPAVWKLQDSTLGVLDATTVLAY